MSSLCIIYGGGGGGGAVYYATFCSSSMNSLCALTGKVCLF